MLSDEKMGFRDQKLSKKMDLKIERGLAGELIG
jgi:hypothetical protein